jgi:hypothetical protein
MKTVGKLGIILGLASMAAYAETWDGKLIDATCFENFSSSATDGRKAPDLDKLDKDCAPTPGTTTFAVIDHGKVYKLDAIGNTKVAADVYGGAVKPDKDRDVHVTVKGKLQGDTIIVESVKGK